MNLPTILLVEDEQVIALNLEVMLTEMGYTVLGIALSGTEALVLAAQHIPDLILMDIHLHGELDGITTVNRLQAMHPTPVIYLTAHSDQATLQRAAATNPFGYIIKPFREHEIQALLTLATHRHSLERRLAAEEHRFSTTLQSLTEGVLVTDTTGRLLFLNQAACTLLQVQDGAVLHRPLQEVLVQCDEETDQSITGLIEAVVHTREPLRLQQPICLRHHDGRHLFVEVQSTAIYTNGGPPDGVVTVIRDISERLAADVAVQQANQQLRDSIATLERQNAELEVLHTLASELQLAMTSTEACMAVVNAVRRFFPTDSGLLLLHRPEDNLLEPGFAWGIPLITEQSFPTADCVALREQRVFVSAGSTCAFCPHAPISSISGISCVPLSTDTHSVGTLLLGHAQARQALTDGGNLADRRRLAAALADQASLGLANVLLREALHEQAIRDSLTGLFNRRYMEETMLREIVRAERHNYPIGLILLDIDYFKTINDTYGHPAGDTVLRAVGALLRTNVRASDLACRYGGEEFLLVLPTASESATIARAELICEAVRLLHIVHHELDLPPITISAGVSVIGTEDDDVSMALTRADRALYAAKHAGRNQVRAER